VIEFGELIRGQRTQELSQVSFCKASQVVANDPTFVFHPLVYSNGDLRRDSFTIGEHWRAYDSRVAGVNQCLTADDNANTVLFGVAFRIMGSINVSSLHTPELPVFRSLLIESVYRIAV
jgi:hypothetical protein